MPTSFLSADTSFPRLTSEMPAEEKLNRIESYLWMLLEQLRYTLSNLGEDNFNETSLKKIGEAINAPVISVVTDLQGNVSSLEQTASSLTTRISNAEGDISTLEQTASSLTTRIGNAEGDISSLEQTASSLTTRVSNAEGDISQVSQTANKINWIVASGTSASNMTMTSDAINVISDQIGITGYVTFSSLETAGQSVINGDNIELKADADGDSVSYLTYKSVLGNTFGEIYTRDNRSGTTQAQSRYAFVIETPATVDGESCSLKLIGGDAISLECGYMLYMKSDFQTVVNSGDYPTRIQANNVSYSSQHCPADCYSFCSDGIYYGGVRILST